MKKEINSKSKRKWIMGGLAAFASIALLTTGFAVWIVGTVQTSAQENVEVSVDTAQNNSIVMLVNMDSTKSSIKLVEDEAIENGKIVSVSQTDVKDNPLRIGYKSITISYGVNYDFNFKSIQFSIAEPDENETGYASVKTTDGGKLTGTYKRAETSYTYIDAPKAISLTSYTATTEGNTKKYTLPESTLDFSWGTFFDGKSPASYYNNLYSSEESYSVLTEAADKITDELNDMHTQLDGKKIKLVATLSTEAVY